MINSYHGRIFLSFRPIRHTGVFKIQHIIDAINEAKRPDVNLFVDQFEMEAGCDVRKCYAGVSISDIFFVAVGDTTFDNPEDRRPDWVRGEVATAVVNS